MQHLQPHWEIVYLFFLKKKGDKLYLVEKRKMVES